MGRGKDAVIINFSKTFDIMLHDLLLSKLKDTGVDIQVLSWIHEF